MPIKRSSFKDVRRSDKRHSRNLATKSEIKTLVKKFDASLLSKNKEAAKVTLNSFASKMDKAASKGVFKRNTASRKISRLMKRLNSLDKT